MKNEQRIHISVIIPVYNGEKYIAACIETLLRQTMETGYELIFIDDGSKDKTLEIIRSYAKQDSRIRFFSQENKGVSAARNSGINNSRGEWIVFVDVDDEIAPKYLQDISWETRENPSTSVFVYARHYVEKDSKTIDTTKFTRKELICSLLTEEPIKELGTDFLLFAVWNRVYKKSFLQDNNIAFVEGLRWGEDLIFQCRIYQCAEEIRFVYRGYYRYVQNNDSTIHRSRKDDIETIKKIQWEMKQALTSLWTDTDIKRAYYLSILNGWLIAISSELAAWKQQESFAEAYRHLKRILQESQLQEVINNVKTINLNKKAKFKLLLLRRLPLGYVTIVREKNKSCKELLFVC